MTRLLRHLHFPFTFNARERATWTEKRSGRGWRRGKYPPSPGMESSVIQSSSHCLLYWVSDPALARNSNEFSSCFPIYAQGNGGNPLKLSDRIICTLDPNTLRHGYKSDVILPCWRAWGKQRPKSVEIEFQKWLLVIIFEVRHPIDSNEEGDEVTHSLYNQISLCFHWLQCFPNEHHLPPPPPLTFQCVLLNLDTARCYATQNRSGYLGSRSTYSAKFIQYIACLFVFYAIQSLSNFIVYCTIQLTRNFSVPLLLVVTDLRLIRDVSLQNVPTKFAMSVWVSVAAALCTSSQETSGPTCIVTSSSPAEELRGITHSFRIMSG